MVYRGTFCAWGYLVVLHSYTYIQQTMVLGGGRCLSPQFLVVVFVVFLVPVALVQKTENNAAPLRVPKINLVADYSPGGPCGTPS